MIDKRDILEAASALGLLPGVVEKDYVLGWLLAGIDAHSELSASWVFKGGTCLKKCYFETGACQVSCRLNHAAICRVCSALAAVVLTTESRSGLRLTTPMCDQSRV
ncbi:MAG: nucleotidyl transferase AbiEii/AbiGii toxin family protein, partial [Betaproteobacteria bacterium]